MPRSSHLGHRAPVLWLLLPFAAGIAAAHQGLVALPASGAAAGAVAALGGAALALQRERLRWWGAGWVAGLILLGAGYYELRRDRLPDWNALPEREARLTVEVTRILADAGDGDYARYLGRIVATPPHLADLVGQELHLGVRFPGTSLLIWRGSLIDVTGVLEPLPRRAQTDGFEEYLTDSGHNFRLRRGWLHTTTSAPESYYAFARELVKGSAWRSLRRGLRHHPELVAALHAMLLGERRAIDEEAKSLFVRSGTMHLFAISGLHIGVIAGVLYGLLRLGRVRPLAAFLIGAGLLAFYVDVIGGTPSARRAWIMVTCVQAGWVLRAPGNPLSGLAVAALLVLLLDPMQLFSAGFQMSFGIVAALLLYGLPLGERWQATRRPWRDVPAVTLRPWQRWWAHKWEECATVVALSVAATQIGLVSGIAYFGWFTPVTLVANLLLIPLASLAIVGGFAAVVMGFVGATPLVLVFNHAAALLLAFMQGLLEILLAAPGTAWPAAFRHEWVGPGLTLALIALMTIGYERRWEGSLGRFWLSPTVLAVALVTLTRLG